MATVPAVRFVQAVREVLVAVLIAAVGALAVVGFEPEVAPGPVRVHHPRPGPGRRAGPRLPARRRPARPRPPRHRDRRRRQRAARGHPRVRRGAAPLRHPRPGRVDVDGGRAGCGRHLGAFPRPIRRCSASPRSPGAATCAPGAARAGGCARSASPPPRRSPTPRSTPDHRVTEAVARGACTPGGRLLVGYVVIRVDLAPHRLRVAGAAAGPRRPPPSGPSRGVPAHCSEPPRREHLHSSGAAAAARRGAGVADRNRLESGRWQRCQPRVRIPPPLPTAELLGVARLLGTAELQLDLVVGEVVQALEVVRDVGEQALQLGRT